MKVILQSTFIIAAAVLSGLTGFAQDTSPAANGTSKAQEPMDGFELRTFTASARNGKVFVNWSVMDLSGECAYMVQRSFDGDTYDNIGIKKGAPSPANQTALLFSFVDNKPGTGTVYYRIKRISNDGVTATRTIKVNLSDIDCKSSSGIAFQ